MNLLVDTFHGVTIHVSSLSVKKKIRIRLRPRKMMSPTLHWGNVELKRQIECCAFFRMMQHFILGIGPL